jgi:hypothetical protein
VRIAQLLLLLLLLHSLARLHHPHRRLLLQLPFSLPLRSCRHSSIMFELL